MVLLPSDREANSIITIKAGYGRLDFLQKLLERAKEKLTEDEINKLLATKRDGKYCLHSSMFWQTRHIAETNGVG